MEFIVVLVGGLVVGKDLKMLILFQFNYVQIVGIWCGEMCVFNLVGDEVIGEGDELFVLGMLD